MENLREQFIERLLRELFVGKGSGFALKGGGAMRALFGEQRLTKAVDLDFTNPKRTAASLHNTVNRAISAASRGLRLQDVRVSQPRKGEMTPRWKINFRDADGQPLHVEVEVSRQAERSPPGQVVQKRFSPRFGHAIGRFWVDVYDQPTLIATKLAALLGRAVPRDVYDLDLLMAGLQPTAEQVQWALGRSGLDSADAVATMHAHLRDLTWDRYITDLRDSLPENVAGRIDESEWDAMKLRVREYAELLLKSVTGSGP